MTFWEGEKRKKPERWGFDRSLVNPEWQKIADHMVLGVPMWGVGSTDIPSFGRIKTLGTRTAFGGGPAPAILVSRFGPTFNFVTGVTADDGGHFTWGDPVEASFTEAVTIFVLVYYNSWSFSNISGAIGKWGAAQADRAYTIFTDAVGEVHLGLGDGTSTFQTTVTAAQSLNVWYFMVGSWSKAGGVGRIYVDGVLNGTVALTSSLATNTSPLEVGRLRSDGSPSFFGHDGQIAMAGVLDIELSAVEIQQWSCDPFGPFRMVEDAEWLSVAAAGGATPHGPLGHPLWGPFAGPVVV